MAPFDPILHNHEDRLKALEAARRSLDDSMIVMMEIERRHSAAIKDHEDWLAEEAAYLVEQERERKKREREQQEWKSHHELAMKEFDDKLNGLIAWLDDFVRRNPPKNGEPGGARPPA